MQRKAARDAAALLCEEALPENAPSIAPGRPVEINLSMTPPYQHPKQPA
jgi:hypothetical protein